MRARRIGPIVVSMALAGAVVLMPGMACGQFSALKTKNALTSNTSSFVIENGGPNTQFKVCQSAPAVGRTSIQRLNRLEYNNTLRDLLGIASRPADQFPEDPIGSLFNNNADTLNLTTAQLDLYISAAEAAINEAFTSNRARFMICTEATPACATRILSPFADRAFRRPATSAEVNRLINFVTIAQGQGESFEVGIKLALRAILSSPQFLFRTIENSAPDNSNHVVALNAFELASRLSYFLWSSMPDDALFSAARDGFLLNSSVLEAQVRRMLADPKSQALVDGFAAYWLRIPVLMAASPNTTKFPEFTAALRNDMATESKLFFAEFLRQDLPIAQLLKADYTFINNRLASHYGISGIVSTSFQKVSLTQTGRSGILGHAGLLTATSHSEEPSIVKRGNYVASQLICDPPMPPPITPPANDPNSTEESRSNQRLTNASCMGCHLKMDPIGKALQGFNAIGKFRTADESGAAIDDRGQLTTGQTFRGAAGLNDVLAGTMQFNVCVSKKLAIYALGRELSQNDDCAISQIAAESSNNKPFSSLILGLIKNDAFRKQSGGL